MGKSLKKTQKTREQHIEDVLVELEKISKRKNNKKGQYNVETDGKEEDEKSDAQDKEGEISEEKSKTIVYKKIRKDKEKEKKQNQKKEEDKNFF